MITDDDIPRRATDDDTAEPSGSAPPAVAAIGDAPLRAWVAAGLIDADQAERISRWEAQRQGTAAGAAAESLPPARRPVVVEALAYVGGAVIAAALTMVFFSYWEALNPVVRIVVPATATAVLLAGGALVPQRAGAFAVRLRAVLWTVSVATFVAVVAQSLSLAGIAEPAAPRWGAAAVACYATVLWLLNRAVPQHLATFTAVEFLMAVVTNWDGDFGGIRTGASLVVVAVVWSLAAWRGLWPGLGRWAAPANRPIRADRWAAAAAQRRWGMWVAAVGATIGGIVLATAGDGAWLGVVSVALIIGAAVGLGDVVIVGIGAVAALIVLPTVADHYLHSTMGVAVVLLVTGAALVGLAVAMVRRQRTMAPSGDH